MIVVVKDDPQRVDNAQAMLELNRLQFLGVSRLRCNGTHLHGDAPSKGHDKHSRLKTNAMRTLARLRVLIRLLLPTFGKPTVIALGRARFVRLEEAEQRRRGSRGEVGTLMRARGAE